MLISQIKPFNSKVWSTWSLATTKTLTSSERFCAQVHSSPDSRSPDRLASVRSNNLLTPQRSAQFYVGFTNLNYNSTFVLYSNFQSVHHLSSVLQANAMEGFGWVPRIEPREAPIYITFIRLDFQPTTAQPQSTADSPTEYVLQVKI